MEVFAVTQPADTSLPSGELQQNIREFEKEYGNNFKIKYKDNIINVNLGKAKLPNDTEFYRMTYDIPHRITELTPFIIDFIDMQEEEHRRQVLHALEKALVADHAKTSISSVSPLGLVEMTRKRTRESLEHMLCVACPTCEGRGFVKTTETVCYEIFREILRQSRQFNFQVLMVLAHQDVIERLLDEESAALAELEVHTGKPIRLQTEALYQQHQYDVVLM